MIETDHQLFCPACGRGIVAPDPPRAYCPHVEYVYGWGEQDGFVYAAPAFARRHLEAAGASGALARHLEEAGRSITADQRERFARGDFEPLDEVACLVPPPEDAEAHGLRARVSSGHHSGACVGLDLRAETEGATASPAEGNDCLALYDLEGYLLGPVRERFHRDGHLSAFDFFCIVIWKANRAKSRVAAKLRAAGLARGQATWTAPLAL